VSVFHLFTFWGLVILADAFKSLIFTLYLRNIDFYDSGLTCKHLNIERMLVLLLTVFVISEPQALVFGMSFALPGGTGSSEVPAPTLLRYRYDLLTH
jgi:hypothetical protein